MKGLFNKKDYKVSQEYFELLNDTLRAKMIQTRLFMSDTNKDQAKLQNNIVAYGKLQSRIKDEPNAHYLDIAKEIAKTENLNGKATEGETIEQHARNAVLSGNTLNLAVESILNMTDTNLKSGFMSNFPEYVKINLQECLDKNFHYVEGYGREYIAPKCPESVINLMEKVLGIQNKTKENEMICK